MDTSQRHTHINCPNSCEIALKTVSDNREISPKQVIATGICLDKFDHLMLLAVLMRFNMETNKGSYLCHSWRRTNWVLPYWILHLFGEIPCFLPSLPREEVGWDRWETADGREEKSFWIPKMYCEHYRAARGRSLLETVLQPATYFQCARRGGNGVRSQTE